MPASADIYLPFVPRRLVRHHQSAPDLPQQGRTEACAGAVLLADVIGYTSLTESYSQRGTQGVEELQSLLRVFFGRIEALTADYGGDIISFAGDSVLALWSAATADDLSAAARLAVQCAQAARDALDGADLGGGQRLRLCISIAAGELLVATVGGLEGDWKYVATGKPLAAAGAALKRADPGDVVLATEVMFLVSPYCAGMQSGDGCFRLTAITEALAPAPLAKPDASLDCALALRSYIPKPVIEHLDAGHADWLAEFRRATVLFTSVRDVDYRDPDALSRLQGAVAVMQRAVHRYEGVFARLIVDDKGTNALSAWGIPGCGHEDDPARAVLACLAMREGLRNIGIECGAGIATGRVLCGLSGGGSRYEYTVTGDTVNLAARLMVAAEAGVLCDGATSDAAGSSITFEHLAPLAVKGRASAIPVARPAQPGAGGATHHRPVRASTGSQRLVGRAVEWARLLGNLDALHAGAGGLITIEGEPGVGKSRLIAELTGWAQAVGLHCLAGHADAIEDKTTYFAWRAILEQMFARAGVMDPGARRAYLEVALESEPVLCSWLPVLNDMLSVGFTENAVTAQMSEHARAESISELLLRLLHVSADRAPLLLVLDDAHWMDSMSWNLAARVQRRMGQVLLVLGMRSGYTPESDESTQLMSLETRQRIVLDSLAQTDTETLLRSRLDVRAIAPEIVAFVHGKTEGNPLFSEELASMLRDSGFLRIEDGRCEIAPGIERIEALEIRDTIQGIITSRIELLSPSEQFTLKVASVAGRGFSEDVVRAIHPFPSEKGRLSSQFETFAALDLIRPAGKGGDPGYSFKHAITQEVTYGLLAPSQCRQLHHAAAVWYEEANRPDPAAVYPLLAHHWSQADYVPKAFQYLHLAGKQAFDRYANREAAGFLEKALAFHGRLGEDGTREARARCLELLGHARLWLGELSRSQTLIEQSLTLTGRPVPTSRRGLLLGASGQIAMIPFGGIVRRLARHDDRRVERDKATALDLLRLGHIAYFNSDTALSLYTSARCLNYAGRAKPSGETALIYAAQASGAAMVPVHWLARRFVKLALRAAETVGEPEITSQVYLFVSMYAAGVGDWRPCIETVRQAKELARITSNSRRVEDCMVVLGYLHFHSGELATALADYEDVVAAGRARGDRQTTGWGLLGVSRVQLALGRATEALRALEQATPLVADRLSRIELQGQRSLAHLRLGEWQKSWMAAHLGLELVRAARPSSFSTLTGTAAIAESLLELWELVRQDRFAGDPVLLGRQSLNAILALRHFAGIFPIGAPQFLLQAGRYRQLLGQRRRATRLWRAGLARAGALGMPHEATAISLAMEHQAMSPRIRTAQTRDHHRPG